MAKSDTAQPDLTGFLLAHAAMRQEFGLLADVAAQPLDAERAALFEDQVAMVLDNLHHHHTAEDDTIWPWLRERQPAAREGLDELEADHDAIDPLIRAAGDRTVPPAERAATLRDLHERLNAHLDREEALAVPLIRQHVTVAEWEALAKRAAKETGRNIPRVYGWYASAVDEERVTAALRTVPVPVRVLFRLFWRPAYNRRARRLYGANLPAGIAS
jgi:iron-sulfur cluster repair protein YtfE (RIC family)